MTYPDPKVEQAMSEGFEGVQIDLTRRHPDFKPLAARGKVLWAPTFWYMDSRGREIRRRTGWLPPEEFLAELELVRALQRTQEGAFEEGRKALARVARDHPDSFAAPEALFWAGSAAYLGGGQDMGALAEQWDPLLEDHRATPWGLGASTIEDWDPEGTG